MGHVGLASAAGSRRASFVGLGLGSGDKGRTGKTGRAITCPVRRFPPLVLSLVCFYLAVTCGGAACGGASAELLTVTMAMMRGLRRGRKGFLCWCCVMESTGHGVGLIGCGMRKTVSRRTTCHGATLSLYTHTYTQSSSLPRISIATPVRKTQSSNYRHTGS